MLFDLEDYATIWGCTDKRATNYNPNATRSCADCCVYPNPPTNPYQEATSDGDRPISEDCCLKLNDTTTAGYGPWKILTDRNGVKRCIRSILWDYFYNRS